MTIDEADFPTPAPALELLRHLFTDHWTSAQIADFFRDLPRDHDHVLDALEEEMNDAAYDAGYVDGHDNGYAAGYEDGVQED